nr:hypothetical protein [Chitinophagaceae bacterium]
HIDSIGGEKNWAAIKSVQIQSSISNEGETIRLNKQIIKNKSLRQDITFNGRDASAKEMKYFILLLEKEGWKMLPDTDEKVVKMGESEFVSMQEDMDFEDPFLFYESKHREVDLLPLEYIGDNVYYKFIMRYPSGRTEYIYIDSKTMLITQRIKIGTEYESSIQFEQYEKLKEGIVISKKNISTIGTTLVDKIVMNAVIPASLFDPMKIYNYR